MLIKKIKSKLTYDGTQLSSLFAYKNFGVQGNSVVAFCGPCHVDLQHLVDQEDVLQKAFIHSEEMVHFIVEIFNLALMEGIFRQRLYIAIIKEVLEKTKPNFVVNRYGDDIFIQQKKLSVSIATLSPVSTLIHIGINISSKNTPVPAIGLNDLKIKPAEFIDKVLNKIQEEENDIALARCKVRGVL